MVELLLSRQKVQSSTLRTEGTEMEREENRKGEGGKGERRRGEGKERK